MPALPTFPRLSVEAAAALAWQKITVINSMAESMREADALRGCCTIDDLKRGGFTTAQITLYVDDARVLAAHRSRTRRAGDCADLPYEAAGIGQPVHPRGQMAGA